MNEEDKKELYSHATSVDMVKFLSRDTKKTKNIRKLRFTSIILALLTFGITFLVAANANIFNHDAFPDSLRYGSPQSQLLFVSFLGLCMIFFSHRRVSSSTGLYPLFSWIPIDTPTPLFLFHIVGWVLMLIVLAIFLFV